MRACSGVWVAHGSGSRRSRDAPTATDRVKVPPGEESYLIRRVWLSAEEEQGYYYGFSNEGLWPLCHIAHTVPIFRADDWEHYQAVNRRFAEAVCDEADSDDPIILVQDYHFALAPADDPDAPAARDDHLTFWHIPWPNAERMAICPWRDELLEGLLGSSIVGFHTQPALQQLPGLGRLVSRERASTASRRRRAAAAHDAGAAVSDLDRVAEPLDGQQSTDRRVPRAASWRSSACRREPCSESGSTGSTTRRASRSASWPSSGCWSGIPQSRGQVHLRSAGGAQPHQHRALPHSERSGRSARRPHQRNDSGKGDYRPIVLLRVAPRAAGGIPLSTAPRTCATSAVCMTG